MNKTYKTIITNLLYNYIYQILLILIPLITAPYITRVFSTESLGKYTYYYTIATYFALFAMLGINNYGNRTIAMAKASSQIVNKTFSEILSIQFLVSLFATVIFCVFGIYVPSEDRTLVFITNLYVVSTIIDYNWFFFGLEKFRLTVSRNIVIKIVSTICIFAFVKEDSDIYIYALLMCGSFVVSNLILIPYLIKYYKFTFPKLKDLVPHIKPILLLFIPVVAVSVYKYMDKIMLGNMVSMTEVTMYEYAEKINSIPHSFVAALGTVMLPRTSALIKEGKNEEASSLLQKTLIGIAVLTPALAFGLASISPELVPLFLGDDYARCGLVVQFIAFMLIFIAANNVIRTQVLLPMQKDVSYIIALCGGSVSNLLCNMMLIPRLGAIGAAIGTVIAELIVFIIQIIFTRKIVEYKKYFICLLISTIMGCLMFFFLRNVIYNNNTIVEIVLRVVVGVLLYSVPCGGWILLRYFRRKNGSEKYSE